MIRNHSLTLRDITHSIAKKIVAPKASIDSLVKVVTHDRICCCCLVTKSCPTLCDPVDYKPAMQLCPWDFLGKNSGVGCYFLLQGIFPMQGIQLRSPTLRADALPSEPLGKLQ